MSHGRQIQVAMYRSQPSVARLRRLSSNRHQTSLSLFPTTSYSCKFRRYFQTPVWRPTSALDQYVAKDARPISLRQLTFFGRNLTEERLLSSANYVRTELPTRLAHRIRDMQKLPYVVVTNPHMSAVYETYYKSFELFRKFPEIKTTKQNDAFCSTIKGQLVENLTVIPNLATGVLECRDLVSAGELDGFMNLMLKSRISRRTIAEQHVALTETFNSPFHFPDANADHAGPADNVGEVLLKCNAKDVVERCGRLTQDLSRSDSNKAVPEILIEGHLDATFPYIPSHLEYIIGELLRNSMEATIERHSKSRLSYSIPPISVLICHTHQHVIFRISDQGGGIPQDLLPHIWSFSKGPRKDLRLRNFTQVPTMAATMQELFSKPTWDDASGSTKKSSLSALSHRPPDLKLGLGLPMSRVYAEYWAGSLKLHSLDGYGTDVFLSISKLGNQAEQLTERMKLDGV